MKMRIRYEQRGGHVHCRVFTAPEAGATFTKNGELVFDIVEWSNIQHMLRNAEFVREGSAEPEAKPSLQWFYRHPGSMPRGHWFAIAGAQSYSVHEHKVGTYTAAFGFECLGRTDTENGAKALCEAHWAKL